MDGLSEGETEPSASEGWHCSHEKGRTWEQRIEVGPCTSQKCVKESYEVSRGSLKSALFVIFVVIVSRAIATCDVESGTYATSPSSMRCDAMRRDE